MWYYQSKKDDSEVIDKLTELAERYPTRGFDEYYLKIRREGLAAHLNISEDKAQKMITDQGLIDVNDNLAQGNNEIMSDQKLILNNNMTEAISNSKGNTAKDVYIDGKPIRRDTKNDSYMCQESCITGSKGEVIGSTNTLEFYSQFKEVKSFDDLSFGKGAVYFQLNNGEEHYMLPYGKSNDGKPYVFSKEGTAFKPGVYPLGSINNKSEASAMNFQRAINLSEIKTVKFFKYVGKTK